MFDYLFRINLAGLPAQTSLSGISLVTIEPAPITEFSPIITGLQMMVLQPKKAFLLIWTLPLISGFLVFIK